MVRCTMIRGDCLEVMPTLPKGSIRLCIADLPYGHKQTRLRWDSCIDLQQMWANFLPLAQAQWAACFTASFRLAVDLYLSAKNLFRYDLVFRKSTPTGYLNAKRQPMRQHETLLVFGERPIFNPVMRAGTTDARGKAKTSSYRRIGNGKMYGSHGAKQMYTCGQPRYPVSVVDAPRINDRGYHPTEKPVSLMDWLIRSYTQPGDSILDPCAGSAASAIAALRAGRNVTCIESDPDYFAASVERVRQAIRTDNIETSCDVIG